MRLRGRSPTAHLHPVGVGLCPSALAVRPDGKALYVADTLDDTVSVIDLPTGILRGKIALGPRPEPTLAGGAAALLRRLRLAHDGWMSRQSGPTPTATRTAS